MFLISNSLLQNFKSIQRIYQLSISDLFVLVYFSKFHFYCFSSDVGCYYLSHIIISKIIANTNNIANMFDKYYTLVILLFLTFFFFAYLTFKMEQSQVLNPFILRLGILMTINLMVILSIFVFSRISGKVQKAFLTWLNCLIYVIAMTIGESIIHKMNLDHHSIPEKYTGPYQHLEDFIVITYYTVLMCSGVGFFVSVYYLTVWSMIRNKEYYLQEKRYASELGESKCPICLADMDDQNEQYVELINCQHVFHRQCLNEWTASHMNCPLCRRDIFKGEVHT